MLAGRRCLGLEWLGDLLIVHHHWRHSYQLCACSRSKFPIAPMGFSHLSHFVLAGWRRVHRRWHGELLIVHHHWQHSYWSACSCSKVPIAPMGLSDVLRLCLQGGAVGVQSGSVTFSSCTITGNTATGFVCAHVRKFPSPRLENALLTYPNRFSSFMIDLPVSSTCHLRLKLQKFPSPRWENADALA